MLHERLHQVLPALAVRAESGLGVVEIALEDHGGAVVERMGQRRGRMNPLQTVRLERQGRKEWRPGSEGMDRRAKIVKETGFGQRQRAGGTARLRLGFENVHMDAALGQGDRGGKAIGA